MGSEDVFVDFAGGVTLFVAEDGADDDVSIVKPQVVALVRLYLVACFAFVNSWPLGGKEGVCWGRHGAEDMCLPRLLARIIRQTEQERAQPQLDITRSLCLILFTSSTKEIRHGFWEYSLVPTSDSDESALTRYSGRWDTCVISNIPCSTKLSIMNPFFYNRQNYARDKQVPFPFPKHAFRIITHESRVCVNYT